MKFAQLPTKHQPYRSAEHVQEPKHRERRNLSIRLIEAIGVKSTSEKQAPHLCAGEQTKRVNRLQRVPENRDSQLGQLNSLSPQENDLSALSYKRYTNQGKPIRLQQKEQGITTRHLDQELKKDRSITHFLPQILAFRYNDKSISCIKSPEHSRIHKIRIENSKMENVLDLLALESRELKRRLSIQRSQKQSILIRHGNLPRDFFEQTSQNYF